MTVAGVVVPRSLSSWKRGAGTSQRREWGGACPTAPLVDGFLLEGRNDGWGVVVPAELVLVETGMRVPRGGIWGRASVTRPNRHYLLEGRNDGMGRRFVPAKLVLVETGSGYPETVRNWGGAIPNRPRDGFLLLRSPWSAGMSGDMDIAPHDHPCESRGPTPFMAPSTRSEPAPYLIRGRTGRGAGIYRVKGMDSCSGAGMYGLGLRQDARYPFSANLPDRYLWMTLDSSVQIGYPTLPWPAYAPAYSRARLRAGLPAGSC